MRTRMRDLLTFVVSVTAAAIVFAADPAEELTYKVRFFVTFSG